MATVPPVQSPLYKVVGHSPIWSCSDFPGIWPTHCQAEIELLRVPHHTREREPKSPQPGRCKQLLKHVLYTSLCPIYSDPNSLDFNSTTSVKLFVFKAPRKMLPVVLSEQEAIKDVFFPCTPPMSSEGSRGASHGRDTQPRSVQPPENVHTTSEEMVGSDGKHD